MKPLLVGLNNPYGGDDSTALYPSPEGCTGHRIWQALCKVGPISRRTYCDLYDRTNLWQGELPTGKGKTKRLREAGKGLLDRVERERRHDVVVFGAVAWDAIFPRATFGTRPPELDWMCVDVRYATEHIVTAHYAPHPSGRNPFYNDEERVIALGEMLVKVLHHEELPRRVEVD